MFGLLGIIEEAVSNRKFATNLSLIYLLIGKVMFFAVARDHVARAPDEDDMDESQAS